TLVSLYQNGPSRERRRAPSLTALGRADLSPSHRQIPTSARAAIACFDPNEALRPEAPHPALAASLCRSRHRFSATARLIDRANKAGMSDMRRTIDRCDFESATESGNR